MDTGGFLLLCSPDLRPLHRPHRLSSRPCQPCFISSRPKDWPRLSILDVYGPDLRCCRHSRNRAPETLDGGQSPRAMVERERRKKRRRSLASSRRRRSLALSTPTMGARPWNLGMRPGAPHSPPREWPGYGPPLWLRRRTKVGGGGADGRRRRSLASSTPTMGAQPWNLGMRPGAPRSPPRERPGCGPPLRL